MSNMMKTAFLRRVNTSWKMRLFLFWKLPGAWFMGVRLRHCDGQRAEALLPYNWFSQNPFRSTYFAAQCAAGEFSTGILVLYAITGEAPVSMLVTRMEAQFFKKVSQTLVFTCEEGENIQKAVQSTLSTGEGVEITTCGVGTLPDGTVATKIWVTWSLRRKG